ncbi:MAG: RpoL/Rpb11 RNA polymerase subunit family protein [Candidatus Woesearchaeota archaeon]
MNLKILEEKNNKLIFELDTNYAIAELLISELRNDKNVNLATYNRDHPQIEIIRFIIEGKDPKKSIKEALKRLRETLKSSLNEIEEKIE